jgi:hypothetical protein
MPAALQQGTPPRTANRSTVAGDRVTAKWAPPTTVLMGLKINPKPISSMRKIDRNGLKFREYLWRYIIKFGTLFIIETSSKSPQILKYSKDSKSKLI